MVDNASQPTAAQCDRYFSSSASDFVFPDGTVELINNALVRDCMKMIRGGGGQRR